MDALPQQFVQYFRQGTWSEGARLDDGDRSTTRPVHDAPYLALPGRRTAAIKRALAAGLRLLAGALYLSPLLVLVAALTPAPRDAYLAVAFTLVVVAFFFVLVLFVLASVLHHVATRNLDVRLDPPAEADLVLPAGGRGERVASSGVVTALDGAPRGAPVLVDLWCTSATPPWRATAGADFAVVAFGQPTLVVRHDSAPLLVAEDERDRFTEALARLPDMLRERLRREARAALDGPLGGEARVLRVGDRVEVIAASAEDIPNLARFELGSRVVSFDPQGAARQAPYRGGPGQPGRLLRSSTTRAVRIRRLGR